jgi:hypothetical protein
MEAGQVWEGRSKTGYGMTRRKIIAITETSIKWELVGSCFKGPKSGTLAVASWLSWTKLQVIR